MVPQSHGAPSIFQPQGEETPYTWTIYDVDLMNCEHLTQEQSTEVFNIVMQEDPRQATPTTWEQEAFLLEDVFYTAREEMAKMQDNRRRERLMELGVIEPAEEELYDWSLTG